MKRSSVGYVTAPAYPDLARHARVLADYEGFSSHANSVSEVRDEILERSENPSTGVQPSEQRPNALA